jgi:putative membrane protein
VNFLVRILVNGLAVLIASFLLPGVHVNNMLNAVIVAAVLALLNAFIKPLLILLTIPITVFSFGLFLLVINAGLIMLADYIVPDFEVDGFWWGLLFSIVLWAINSVFEASAKRNDDNTRRDNYR